MARYVLFSSSELETMKLARLLAGFSRKACNIYLRSDIGLGKTSFCRGFLRGLGYHGHVKSPSYTLVESYVLASLTIYHFDFYRLSSFKDLEYIGIRDYFDYCSLRLIEWPNMGINILPREDISVNLEYYRSSLVRKITLEAFSSLGKSILEQSFYHGSMTYAEIKI